MTGSRLDNEQIPLFTFHLPVRLSPVAIKDMAEQAGLANAMFGPVERSEGSIHELMRAEERAVRNAKWLLDLAARREKCRWANLFADPGWYILPDMFIREALGKQTSVSSACLASMSPPTTGLRWVTLLVDRGFIRRTNDPYDHRRVFVHLTTETSGELTDLLSNMR